MANQLVASSFLPPSWRYHVFLSFRGEDTRNNFTSHLYKALVHEEIKTFIDGDLTKGEEISPTLLKAIEESRISLVILSKNYADSRWCLEELVKIHQCRESEQQIIVPVFYKVDPSHVRNQTGCYGAAFIDHERKFEDKEMVIRWRNALKKVGNLSGYHVTEQKYEVDIIGDIVKDILNRLQVLDEIKQQKILALRSNNNKKYLRYIHQRIENLDGLVQFSEEDVKSEYAKFQIEPADSGNGRLVHIKCCSNNRYLTRANHWQFWIVAGAYEPLEDTSHWSCTLFEPMVVHSDKKAVFRLIHVQLRHFVTSFPVNDFHQCLYAGSNTTNLDDDMDVYTFVDLEQLVLPRSVALKSNHNKKYLRYIHQGIPNFDELVQLSGEDVKSEYAKFQMEPADSDYGGLVHIKCCFNNKYLRRANDSRCWIVAGADEPEEDKKRWSCTLFKPVVVHSDNKAVFRLLHVQLGHFVRSRTVNDFNQCLFAGRNTPDLHNMDVFTVIDLEPLVLPRSLALKSNNNKKYLRYIHQRIQNLDDLVQLSEENVKSEYAKFQIEPADGGLVHIKCCFNKYLRRANDHQYWIVAGAYEPEEDKKHWSCTLFKPVVVHSDKAAFRLLHVQLGHFVTSFTANDFNQCLYAGSNTPNLLDNIDVYTVIDLELLVLPRSFALKSNNNKKYLRYIHQGIKNFDELVQLSEEDVKSEYAKFQMEPADGGLVHIKCCFNNKYLRRANGHRRWIVAGADEPEEDKKHWSCTLFKPVVVHSDNKAVFRLLHVQLGHFVRSYTVNGFNQCLFAERNTPNLHNMDVYTIIDLEPLVLPRSLALKSNNNKKYLRYIHKRIQNLYELVQFSEENVKSEYAKFQIEPADGELVHIKCCYNNKYLRRANDHQYWIVAGAYEPEEDKKHWSCTLFEPVVVHSDNKAVIRLIHVQLGHFVRSFTDKDFNQCLFAERSTPNLHNDMDVYTVVDLEPLVLPRSFALISNNNKKYLRYIDQRIENLDELVQLSEEDVKSKHAKFQMEPADSGYGGLVHIKCCVNNKYLRRANDHQYWIVAGANEPEEDKKHWSCTLFKPVVVHSDNKAVFRLLHVQLGHFVRYDFNQCLFAGPNTPNLHDNIDVYTVIDLEPLVLPSSLALKSNKNKKYLRYIRQRIKKLDEIVQLSEEDVKSEYAKFQIEPADGGLVHIKCCYNNKYLRRANDHQHWIVAGADEPEEDTKHWSCTLFEPVVVHSDNKAVFRLLHVQLGHFVTSLTFNDFNPCLCARSNTPNLHDDMDVYTVIDLEPLVLPSPFVLKSNNNNRYLRYMLDQENNILQILQFSAQDRTSEFAQFHVERANSRDHQNIHYVHIKCLNNNKYLRRMDKDNPLILAAADNRDENKERWTCTLFKPESVGPTGNNDNNVLCRLRHVATGLYTKPFVDNRFELRLGEENHDPQEVDVYTAIRTHT